MEALVNMGNINFINNILSDMNYIDFDRKYLT